MKRSITRSVLIAAIAFVAGLVITVIARREPMEPLTPDVLSAARERWNDASLDSYDIRYKLNGSVFDVQVRGGIVHEVLVDGTRPIASDWGHYSAKGLFDLLELEVEHLTDTSGPFGGRSTAVIAKVRFDEHYGYPTRYLRSGGGPAPAVVQVESFAPQRVRTDPPR